MKMVSEFGNNMRSEQKKIGIVVGEACSEAQLEQTCNHHSWTTTLDCSWTLHQDTSKWEYARVIKLAEVQLQSD